MLRGSQAIKSPVTGNRLRDLFLMLCLHCIELSSSLLWWSCRISFVCLYTLAGFHSCEHRGLPMSYPHGEISRCPMWALSPGQHLRPRCYRFKELQARSTKYKMWGACRDQNLNQGSFFMIANSVLYHWAVPTRGPIYLKQKSRSEWMQRWGITFFASDELFIWFVDSTVLLHWLLFFLLTNQNCYHLSVYSVPKNSGEWKSYSQYGWGWRLTPHFLGAGSEKISLATSIPFSSIGFHLSCHSLTESLT